MDTGKLNTNSGMSDLKKMFSAHVQENLMLQRQCSDLDFAKEKKLRELNHNNNVFMRKYEKYAPSSRQGRRSSIDASILRVAEANTSRPGSRLEENISAQKSLGRTAVNSECPYSLDTWNMFVGVDKNFLEENKKKILNKEIDEKKEDIEIPQNTLNDLGMPSPRVMGREKITNSIPVLSSRNTLTPLDHKLDIVYDDTFEEEILCIQKPKVLKPRRHSLNPVHLAVGGLQKIQRRRGSVDASMLGKTGNGVLLDYKRSISDPESINGERETKDTVKTSVSKRYGSRRTSLIEGRQDSVENKAGCKNSASELKGEIVKGNTDPLQSKPIANAAVFVSDERGKSQRVDNTDTKDCELCNGKVQTNKLSDANNNNGQESTDTFLPAITKNVSLTGTPDNKCTKSVSFNLEPMRSRSSSISSPTPSCRTQKPDKSRRKSLTSVSLQYLVDQHHGAAKLKYIALLSTEMQREAGIVEPPSPDREKVFEELQKCRYLRVANNSDDENDLTN